MVKSRFGYRTQIPSVSSMKAQTKSISFKDGANSFKDNDDVKMTEVVSAIDARFAKIGRYRTRKGADRYSVPIGEAVNVSITSTTGASTAPVGKGFAIAQAVTTASAGRATRVDINVNTGTQARGVILVELRSNASGAPGTLLARSSIAASSVSGTLAYVPVYFIAAPALASSQTVWVVVSGQGTAQGYQVSTTTVAGPDDALVREGEVWTPSTSSMNVKLYSSTDTPVTGLIRAYRPNGQKVTMFAYGSTVASVNDTTGATTVLKSDFSPSATAYRAKMVQDATYWVNGLQKPWKYDFNAWTQLTTPYTPSLIEEHKGLLFFNDVDDKTRIFYSNFAEYEEYTSTDFIYVPAPKSYDALTAFAKLNGVLYLFANRNKFQLYGSDNDTFQLDEAASQRGTFSQESCLYDANFIYHADDEGIWRFDGSSEENLALPFLSDYQAITNKGSIRLDLYNNRLYCFYTPNGAADNSECFVMNLLLGVFESTDHGTFVGRTFGRDAQEDIYIQASNRVAALYYGELPSNDHSNLGDALDFEVKTAYGHFDRPGEEKRIPKWRPQFPSQTGDYDIQAGYDLDMANTPTFQDVSIRGSGFRLNTGVLLNTGERLGGQRMVTPLSLFIPGRFRRAQRIYKHEAAREPVELDSEVLSIETQRLL